MKIRNPKLFSTLLKCGANFSTCRLIPDIPVLPSGGVLGGPGGGDLVGKWLQESMVESSAEPGIIPDKNSLIFPNFVKLQSDLIRYLNRHTP